MVRTIILLLLLSGSAHADTMYRCAGKKGAVSYQDYPCGAEAKQTGVAEFTPERVPRYVAPQQAIPARALNVGEPSGAHVPIHAVSNNAACEAAKAYRESTLKSVGLRRTYDLLQQLDDNVLRACK